MQLPPESGAGQPLAYHNMSLYCTYHIRNPLADEINLYVGDFTEGIIRYGRGAITLGHQSNSEE